MLEIYLRVMFCCHNFYRAEDERFELSKEFSPLGHLANAWFQPLTQSSLCAEVLLIVREKNCRYQSLVIR